MPQYTLEKVKFGTDARTFERAVGLYESGKVTRVVFDGFGYTAIVQGTEPYTVYVRDKRFNDGSCSCFLGKDDVLCKHVVALAVHVVAQGHPLTSEEKTFVAVPACSGVLGELDTERVAACKKQIVEALRCIRAYEDPSRTWFAYQNSLDEGCSRIAALVSKLPVSKQTADIIVSLLLRLDKKLCTGGVDDSNGTVGECMRSIVTVMHEFVRLQPECTVSVRKLQNIQTAFGWEESLVAFIKEK